MGRDRFSTLFCPSYVFKIKFYVRLASLTINREKFHASLFIDIHVLAVRVHTIFGITMRTGGTTHSGVDVVRSIPSMGRISEKPGSCNFTQDEILHFAKFHYCNFWTLGEVGIEKMACYESGTNKEADDAGKKICEFFKKAFWPVIQASTPTSRKWTEKKRLKARGLWSGRWEFRITGLGKNMFL